MATLLLTMACGLVAGAFHHQFGVAPVLGAILCAACFLKPKELFLVGLGGMLVRDIVTGFSLFTLVRLVGMGLVVIALLALKMRPTFRSVLVGMLVSSPIFHLVLAVGDWATGTCSVPPETPQGLLAAVVSAVPYFGRSFLGDTLFAGLFLGAYVLAGYVFLELKTKAVSWR